MTPCSQQQPCDQIAVLREELAQARARNEALIEAVKGLEREKGQLQHQLDQCLRRLYGRKSEKSDPRQLFLDDILVDAIELNPSCPAQTPAPEVLIPVPEHTRRAGHGRLEIPEHLERRVIEIDVPEDERICPETGLPMVIARYEETKKLEFVPAKLFCTVYQRPVYVSPDRSTLVPPVMPSLPAFAHDRCKADAGLLAFIVVSKFADALPLYRQQQIWRRQGVELSLSTLDGWVLHAADLVRPLYQIHKTEVLSTGYAASDDTPVTVLTPGQPGSDTGRFWVTLGYRDDLPPLVIFDFSMDRGGDNVTRFFRDYRGMLQADAYSGYNEVFRRNDVTEVGCWSHARRYFERALGSAPAEASHVMGEIRRLFAIEAKLVADKADHAEILAKRQTESRPIAAKLLDTIEQIDRDALPKSPLGEACTYATNQKQALLRYLDDPRLRMDNNLAEQQMKAIATGRKNWLFAGSRNGGEAAAVLMSFVRTCISVGANPVDWFTDVFRRIATCARDELHSLLPQNWEPGPPLPDRIITPPLPTRPPGLHLPLRR